MAAKIVLSDVVLAGYLTPNERVWFYWADNNEKYYSTIVDGSNSTFKFQYSSKSDSSKAFTTEDPATLIAAVVKLEMLRNPTRAHGRNWQCLFRENNGESLKRAKDRYLSQILADSGLCSLSSSPRGIFVTSVDDNPNIDRITEGLKKLRIDPAQVTITTEKRPKLIKLGFQPGNVSSVSDGRLGTSFVYSKNMADDTEFGAVTSEHVVS